MNHFPGESNFDKIFQKVELKTSDYSVTAEDAGKLLVANKAGTFTFTLPAVATSGGCMWMFMQMQDQNLVIAAPADTMVAKNNAESDSVTFSTATEKLGAAAMVICDGTRHYFFNISGCVDGDGAG